MKKPIRFNLQFQDGSIASLADLEDKMNINDLYSNFQSGDLERWLRKRGESERADGVSKLEKSDEKETLLKLFEVLHLGFSEDEIRETVESYERQKKLAQIREEQTAADELRNDDNAAIQVSPQQDKSPSVPSPVLRDYFFQNRFEEYAKMKDKLKTLDKYNLPEIRAVVAEMLGDYPDCFVSDYLLFHCEMCDRSKFSKVKGSVNCPLAVLAVWMNVYWRTRYRQAVELLFNTIKISSNNYSSPEIFPMDRKNGIRYYDEKLTLFPERIDLFPWIKKGCIKVKVLKAINREWEMLIPEEKMAMILFVGNDVEVSVHKLVTEEDRNPMQLSIVEGLKCRLSESYRYNGTVEYGANRLAYIEY